MATSDISVRCEACQERGAEVFAVMWDREQTTKGRFCGDCFETCVAEAAARFGGYVKAVSREEFDATVEGPIEGEGPNGEGRKECGSGKAVAGLEREVCASRPQAAVAGQPYPGASCRGKAP